MTEATTPEITADHTLDNRGSDCASGFARLLEIVGAMASGEVLRVLSSDGAAPRELRDWARRSGNTLLQTTVTGPFWRREYEFLIRKE